MISLRFWKKLSLRQKLYYQLTIGAVLVVLTPLAVATLFSPGHAKAAWFDSNWAFRNTLTLPTHSALESNVFVSFTIDTATLITNGKLKSNCGDLRFTKQDGELLPYYIQGTCNHADTLITVNFDSYPAGVVNIYYYYGNPSAASGANASNFTTSASNNTSYLGGCVTCSIQVGSANNDGADVAGDSNFHTVGGPDDATPWTVTTMIAAGGRNNDGSPKAITGGFRFTTVNIPQGTTVSSAGFDWYADAWMRGGGNYSTNVKSKIYGSKVADAPLFTNTLPSAITKTTAVVNWNSVSEAFSAGATWYSGTTSNKPPAITTIVQEIVNQSGWISGNSLALIFSDNTSTKDWWWDAEVYETNTAHTAKLTATFQLLSPTAGTEENGPGPVLYFKLDDGQGTSANDSSGQNKTGTLAGATKPSWKSEDLCLFGKCLSFPGGTSGSVTVANTVANIKTISFWVRPASASASLLDLDGGTHSITAAAGTITATGFTTPSIYINGTSSAILTANTWQHIEVTTATAISGSAIKVGNVKGDYLQGFMDEVKFYDYVRTASQVKTDFNTRGSVQGASVRIGGDLSYLSQGLVGYWKMDEASGNAADSSGYGLTLTNNSSMVYGTGKFGNAVTCDGTADYLNTATAINGIKTVTFWVKTAAAANNYFINLINSSAYITIDSSGVVSATGFTTPSIYANGVLNGTVAATTWTLVAVTSNTAINANAFAVGLTNDGSNHFCTNTSLIDEVRTYNRAFSSREASDLYNFAPGPLGYWKMDDKVKGASQTILDSSGNGNNGTTYGSGIDCTVPGKYGGGCSAVTTDGINVVPTTPSSLNGSFTVAAWIKPGSLSDWNDIIYTRNPSDYGFDMKVNSTTILGNIGNGSGWIVNSSNPISLSVGNWYHLEFVVTGTGYTIYLNGSQIASGTYASDTPLLYDGSHQLYIAGTTTDYYDTGLIDDVKVYNYARTQKQVVADMVGRSGSLGSPVGYWKFDEGYGTGASGAHNSGSVGSVLDGTLSGSPVPLWTNSGKFGKALSFNGTSAYIAMPSDDTSLKITSGLTLSAWIYLNDTSSQHDIICKYTGTGATSAYCLNVSSAGKLVMQVVNGADQSIVTSTGTTTLSSLKWYHVTGVFTSANAVDLYINGVSDNHNTTSIPTTLQNPTTILDIGAENAGSNLFSGVMDEVKVYNFPLTQYEVKVEYNKGSSMVLGSLSDTSGLTGGTIASNSASAAYCIPGDSSSCASPIGEWRLNEVSGSTAYDTSGNVYNGSITGATYTNGKFNKALNFNGGTNVVDTIPSIAGIKTVSFWVNPFTTTQNLIDLQTSPSTINVSVSGGTVSATGFTSPTIYVNGVVNGMIVAKIWNHVEITTGTAIAGSAVRFGRISTTSLTGQLDEIRFYDYARSAGQVMWDYNKGAPSGLWKLDECSGTALKDSISGTNSATLSIGTAGNSQTSVGTCTDGLSTSAWYNGVSGKYNYSVNFDGADDKATVATGLNTIQSLSFWAKPASSSGTIPFIDLSTSPVINVTSSNLAVSATGWGSPTIYVNGKSGYTTLTASAWNHIVVTSPTSFSAGAITFGLINLTYFKGQIDDVRIYNYALTTNQVKLLYNGSTAISF